MGKKVWMSLLLVMFMILVAFNSYASILINEILANGVHDPDSEWIELFNNDSFDADLTNFSISEAFSKNFTLNMSVPSNGFVVLANNFTLFNSTFPNVNESGVKIIEYGNLKLNFILSNTKGNITLYNSSGSVVDIIEYANSKKDVSIGRYPDGSSSIFNLSTLTPGAKNDNMAPILNKWLNPRSNNTNASDIVLISVNITDDTTQVNSSIININGTNNSMNKNGDLWSFSWDTNQYAKGNYNISISFNDSYGKMAADILYNITTNLMNDTDKDSIPDEVDYLIGDASSINTKISLNVFINGTSNLSKLFNGTFTVNITNGNIPMIVFDFTFNSSSTLTLGNLTINRTTNGSSAVSIKGVPSLLNSRKTIFLEKVNNTAKAVCIKDAEAGFDSISSFCNSQDEFLVNCDSISSNSYTCFDLGSMYKITGLNHSAVKEECRDNDGDGFGIGCSAGLDCNDNNAAKTTDCSSSSASNQTSTTTDSGSGGTSSSTFVCNYDWKCTEWSDCIDGLQKRTCGFVKVTQHAQDTACPTSSATPILNQNCGINESNVESCEDGIKNQDEEGIDCGGVCEPCNKENETTISQENEDSNKITGFSIKDFVTTPKYIGITVAFVILVVASFFVIKLYRRNKAI